jgi:ABC transporter substrate binding protein (PQQ-dependent alcohol dehydrogenase system)
MIIRSAILVLAAALNSGYTNAMDNLSVGYLELRQPRPPLLSNRLPYPKDAGIQGALLGIDDNNSTGRFIGQKMDLLDHVSEDEGELIQTATKWLDQGVRYLVLHTTAKMTQKIAQLAFPYGALTINAGNSADPLRTEICQPNLLHTYPSRAMLADALGQWLISKRLRQWLLVVGTRPEDQAYAAAIERSGLRFGATIVARKQWSFNTDLRRAAQQEMPLFTQADDYDVVVVADELGDFGEYVPYNTWLPRPVVGTQGLTPTAWHRVIEQWGAAQLQSRFDKRAGRWMNSTDYGAWLALRAVGEAAALTGSLDPQTITKKLLDPQFRMGGFKGRQLSFRSWSGQLRQPIPLVHPRALTSQSPQTGYLHPVTDLDTLGYDKSESNCQLTPQLRVLAHGE